MLYVPANNWRLIHRAIKEIEVDAIILDLEDAVPIDDKETARIFSKDAIELLKNVGHTVFVRVNGIATGLIADDLEFIIQKRLDGIILPKAESKEDIIKLERLIENKERERGLKLGGTSIIPLVETARGILNAYDIATASKRIIALCFGAGDYLRDMGVSYVSMSPEETEILFARSHISIVARTAGVLAIDTPYFGLLIDIKGLIKESEMVARLGFKGKQIIHPSHIEPVNRVFSPSEEDIKYAKKVVEVYEEAKKRGLGAASLEGRMIDYMTYKTAKDLLVISEAIEKKRKDVERRKRDFWVAPYG
jgi:citrate lyase subunit beta/citryl-CoA lyase